MEVSRTKMFSIIIPTHNEGDFLRKTIESILSTTRYPCFEIIVAADGCTDESARFLETIYSGNVRLIVSERHVGSPRARNIGARRASGEYFVFMDSHASPEHDHWLHELADQLEYPGTGAATLKIRSWDRPDWIGYVYTVADLALEPGWAAPQNPDSRQVVPSVPGTCFAIRKAVFTATGGFDEGVKRWGREDFEYSLRLWRLGYDLSMSPRAAVSHKFKMDEQGRVRRSFRVTWNHLAYNTLRLAWTLMSPRWLGRITDHLRERHFASLLFAKIELTEDDAFHRRRRILNAAFARSFEEYATEFEEVLPMVSHKISKK